MGIRFTIAMSPISVDRFIIIKCPILSLGTFSALKVYFLCCYYGHDSIRRLPSSQESSSVLSLTAGLWQLRKYIPCQKNTVESLRPYTGLTRYTLRSMHSKYGSIYRCCFAMSLIHFSCLFVPLFLQDYHLLC